MKISYHLKFHLLLVLFLLNTKIIFAQKFEEIKGTYSQGSREELPFMKMELLPCMAMLH